MLGGILLQQGLEVWGASRQDHLMRLATLSVGGNCHIGKRFLIPQVLEAGDHVGLEVIPPKTKLLLIVHPILGSDFF